MNVSMCSSVFALSLIGLTSITCIGCAKNDITPSKALVILTRESMGCLNRQEVKEDVTAKIAHDDNNFATIEEIKNPEDVSNRYEIYLLFPAKEINQLSGFFILKLMCDSNYPKQAYLSVDHTFLRHEKNSWFFSVKAKSDGFFHAQLHYSRCPEFITTRVTYPAADIHEPVKVTFYNTYPLEGDLIGIPSKSLTGKWQRLKVLVNPISLQKALLVDICQQLLEEMDKEFAQKDTPLIWTQEKVKTESLRSLACKVGGNKFAISVALKLDNGKIINTNGDNFMPDLRQKLVLKAKNDKLIGAEIWLRADILDR